MTQELDGGGGEHALLCVDDQARLAQPRENFSQMLQMLLLVPAGNDDVVQVAEDEGKACQDAVHHALEGVARILGFTISLYAIRVNLLHCHGHTVTLTPRHFIFAQTYSNYVLSKEHFSTFVSGNDRGINLLL